MNDRMQFNPAKAAAAGEADARSLLLSVQEGDIPTGQLNDAIGEIVGLAADNRMEECNARLAAFCGILGPVLHRVTNIAVVNTESDRIAGAKQCVAGLAKLENAAKTPAYDPSDVAAYYAAQSVDAEALARQFGPLTPRQEGAFRTLAEAIHVGITSGRPDYERWLPVVAQTQEEIQAQVDEWISSSDY